MAEWIEEIEAHLAEMATVEPAYKPVSPEASYFERATRLRAQFMREFERHQIIDVPLPVPWALFLDGNNQEGSVATFGDSMVRMLFLCRHKKYLLFDT